MVYALYSVLMNLPLVVFVLLLPLLLCFGRMLLQPRGQLRPYKMRDAMCGCGGLCLDCLQAVRGMCGGMCGETKFVSTHTRPEQPHLSSGFALHPGGGAGGGRGSGGRGAEMVRMRSHQGDALDAEETEGFLA